MGIRMYIIHVKRSQCKGYGVINMFTGPEREQNFTKLKLLSKIGDNEIMYIY